MSDSREMFDPYWEWLEIPPEEQPPTYYRLLGLEDFEDDLPAIDDAAKQRTAYLHPMAAGPNRESVQKLLSEVAKARRTLLGSEAKAAYDESLRAAESTLEPAPVFAPPVEQDSGTVSEPSTSGSEDEETEKPEPYRRLRKKSLLNDWRVHVASASVLLIGTVAFVYYSNTKARRVASVAAPVPKARQAKPDKTKQSAPAARRVTGGDEKRSAGDEVMPRAPSKAKKRSAGKSALELMLAQDGLSMDFAKGPEDAMPPGGSRGKGDTGKKQDAKGDLPKFKAKDDMPENWVEALEVIQFTKPLNKRFDVASLKSGLEAVDEKLVIQPTTNPKQSASMLVKGRSLGLGETFAVQTDLTADSEREVQVGARVGRLNVLLRPLGTGVQVRINGEPAGTLSGVQGKGVVLALIRDHKDGERFHWVAQAGQKAAIGSGAVVPGFGKTTKVGVVGKCGVNKPKVDVAIEELRIGKLKSRPVDFRGTQIRSYSAQGK